MPYKRRAVFKILCFVGFLMVVVGVPIYREYRQERLNHQLILAVKHNDGHTVTSLLMQGADANACESDKGEVLDWKTIFNRLRGHQLRGTPVLLLALNNNCTVSIIQALLDRGADANAKDLDGNSALWVANDNYDLASLPLLLRHGANANEPRSGSDGPTLLMYDAAFGDEKEIDLLMNAGSHIDIDQRDLSGGTSLMYAVDRCNPVNVRALLKWHPNLDARDADGNTVLATARAGLKEHRPTPDNHGEEDEGWQEIVELLQKAGARH